MVCVTMKEADFYVVPVRMIWSPTEVQRDGSNSDGCTFVSWVQPRMIQLSDNDSWLSKPNALFMPTLVGYVFGLPPPHQESLSAKLRYILLSLSAFMHRPMLKRGGSVPWIVISSIRGSSYWPTRVVDNLARWVDFHTDRVMANGPWKYQSLRGYITTFIKRVVVVSWVLNYKVELVFRFSSSEMFSQSPHWFALLFSGYSLARLGILPSLFWL